MANIASLLVGMGIPRRHGAGDCCRAIDPGLVALPIMLIIMMVLLGRELRR